MASSERRWVSPGDPRARARSAPALGHRAAWRGQHSVRPMAVRRAAALPQEACLAVLRARAPAAPAEHRPGALRRDGRAPQGQARRPARPAGEQPEAVAALPGEAVVAAEPRGGEAVAEPPA